MCRKWSASLLLLFAKGSTVYSATVGMTLAIATTRVFNISTSTSARPQAGLRGAQRYVSAT